MGLTSKGNWARMRSCAGFQLKLFASVRGCSWMFSNTPLSAYLGSVGDETGKLAYTLLVYFVAGSSVIQGFFGSSSFTFVPLVFILLTVLLLVGSVPFGEASSP